MELLKTEHDCRLLASSLEIGPINTLIILTEADDLRRFERHRQSSNSCGMDLATF